MVLDIGGIYELALASGADVVLLHQATLPLIADQVAASHQLLPHFEPVVFHIDICVDGADVRPRFFVVHALVRTRLTGLSQLVVPAMLKVAANAPRTSQVSAMAEWALLLSTVY